MVLSGGAQQRGARAERGQQRLRTENREGSEGESSETPPKGRGIGALPDGREPKDPWRWSTGGWWTAGDYQAGCWKLGRRPSGYRDEKVKAGTVGGGG